MTTPSIVQTGYNGDSLDYLKARVSSNGDLRLAVGSVTVPASTASGTVIGLEPFRKGARLGYGSRIYSADLDTATTVTATFGYVYDDNTTYTNDPDAFNASLTVQSAGMSEMTAVAGMTWVAEADGWFAVTTGGGSTTTAGDLTFSLEIGYDG